MAPGFILGMISPLILPISTSGSARITTSASATAASWGGTETPRALSR